MTEVKTRRYNFTLPDDTADLFEQFCLEQPNSPRSNVASRLIRNGIDAVCLLHPRFQDAMGYSPHPMSETVRLIAAQQERIEVLEAAHLAITNIGVAVSVRTEVQIAEARTISRAALKGGD